jgi:hypothetical protein
MQLKKLSKALGITALLAGSMQAAQASQVLYDGVGFFQGSQSFEDTFSVSGPGTLSLTLTDFGWPTPLANLEMTVGTVQGLLGPEVGAGVVSDQIVGASTISAQWFGTAAGALDTGLVGLEVQWTPSSGSGATAVPLPKTVGLLLSGLLLFAWRKTSRRRSAEAAGSAFAYPALPAA